MQGIGLWHGVQFNKHKTNMPKLTYMMEKSGVALKGCIVVPHRVHALFIAVAWSAGGRFSASVLQTEIQKL